MAKGYLSYVCASTVISIMLINCSTSHDVSTVVHITSCFIRLSSCREHCPRIIENVCTLCFSSLDCFYRYVFHFTSCSALLSPNNTISSGSSCLASSSAISFWSSAEPKSRSGSLSWSTWSISFFLFLESWIRLKFAYLWVSLITYLSRKSWS